MIIFGVDPGNKSGWCVLGDDGLIQAVGTTDGRSGVAIQNICKAARKLGADVFAIELQFVRFPKQAMSIAATRGRWEGIAEVQGFRRFVHVDRQTWQKSVFGEGRKIKVDGKLRSWRGCPHGIIAPIYTERAHDRWGVWFAEDEAAALWIADYVRTEVDL